MQSREVFETTTGEAQATPSKVTEKFPPEKPAPVIVTVAPPAVVPEEGEIPVIETEGREGAGVGVGVGVASGEGATSTEPLELSLPPPSLQPEERNIVHRLNAVIVMLIFVMTLYREVTENHDGNFFPDLIHDNLPNSSGRAGFVNQESHATRL